SLSPATRCAAQASTVGSATAWCVPAPMLSCPNTGVTSGCCATCSPSEGASICFDAGRLAPVLQKPFDLFDVLVADPLTATIAAAQAVQDVLPHRPRRFPVLHPIAAPLQFPLEAPLPGPLLGAQEAT